MTTRQTKLSVYSRIAARLSAIACLLLFALAAFVPPQLEMERAFRR